MGKSPSVAFVTEFDLSDLSLRSGVPFYLAQSMRKTGIAYSEIRVRDLRNFFDRIQWRLFQLILRKGRWLDTRFSTATLKTFPRQIRQQLPSDTELIFSINPNEVAYLETSIPIVLWIDNSFKSFTSYPAMAGLSTRIKKQAFTAEKLAFQKAKKIYVASGWLKNQLIQQYHFLEDKIAVLPRGANLLSMPGENTVLQAIDDRVGSAAINLLFVCSGDWHRKGGDMVLAIARAMHAKHKVNLVILGKVSQDIQSVVDTHTFISHRERIDKADPASYKKYEQLLLNTHFLVVPSIAEGFGIVYAEAASFGVPSVGLSVMGVTEAIQQDVTGWHFPVETTADLIADKLLEQWCERERYAAVCTSAFYHAQEHFSWEKNISRIVSENLAAQQVAL